MTPSEFREQFDFVEELGRGGMGIVDLYRQRSPSRRVAIKRLKPELLSEKAFRDRFYTEANAAGRLSHPNVVTIFQVVDLPDAEGGPRIVMERIEGGSLSALIDSGSLTPERSYRICAQIAAALAAAHAQGIIHRDLKPCNAMVGKDDLVKVVDFGLARDSGVDPNATTVVKPRQSTEAGKVMGTPDYMSPEQRQGVRSDHRTDVWALGCILYECLTGKVACRLGAGPDLDLLPRTTPAAVRELISGCLQHDRERRVVSARDVFETLQRERLAPEHSKPAPAVRSNLPRERSALVGRRADLGAIRRLIATSQLVTVAGPGGCGKTRAALNLAHSFARAAPPEDPLFRDGVWFADLTTASAPAAAISAIAAALGVREEAGAPPQASIVKTLADKSLLLVLDNCENVHEACAEVVTGILDGCAGVRVLATSRRPLAVPGEQLYPLAPLPVPLAGEDSLGAVAASDAVALFVQRARLVRPDFALTPQNAAAVADICRRLDGLPLALEIAASWMRSTTPADLQRRLQADLGSVVGGSRGDGHGALSGVFASSFERLSEDQKMILPRLAVFRGGWDFPACVAVCGADLDAPRRLSSPGSVLDALVAQSLVIADLAGETARYRMLEPIRAMAHDLLAADPEHLRAVRLLHLSHYAMVARGLRPDLLRAAPAAVAAVEADLDNFRGAMESAMDLDPRSGLELSTSLYRYWHVTGQYREGRRRLLAAVSCRPSTRDGLESDALNALAILALDLADLDDAERRFTASLEIAQALHDDVRTAGLLSNLGILDEKRSRLKDARRRHEEALALYARIADTQGAAKTMLNLGVIDHLEDRLADAERRYLESLREFERLGDQHRAAIVQHNLGEIAFSRRQAALALTRFARSVELRTTIADWPGLAFSLTWAAFAADKLKRAELAAKALDLAAHARDHSDGAILAGFPEPIAALEGRVSRAMAGKERPVHPVGRGASEIRRAVGVFCAECQ